MNLLKLDKSYENFHIAHLNNYDLCPVCNYLPTLWYLSKNKKGNAISKFDNYQVAVQKLLYTITFFYLFLVSHYHRSNSAEHNFIKWTQRNKSHDK